jgi:hypothetical protein
MEHSLVVVELLVHLEHQELLVLLVHLERLVVVVLLVVVVRLVLQEHLD